MIWLTVIGLSLLANHAHGDDTWDRYQKEQAAAKKTQLPSAQDGLPQAGEAAALNAEVESLYRQGLYERAFTAGQKALQATEQTAGPDHPETAWSLNNLGRLYDVRGRYEEAEPLSERALAIRKKTLGPDHPEVASNLSNLARLYEAQGRPAEAKPLYERALAIREKTLGPDHPAVATSLENLAGLYQKTGRAKAAKALIERADAIRNTER